MSDINCSAPSSGLCGKGLARVTSFDWLQSNLLTPNNVGQLECLAIELLCIGGLRISEVLSISCADVSYSGIVKIRSKKGSFQKFVTISVYRDFIKSYYGSSGQIFIGYSRFYFYRLFLKLGLTFQSINSQKQSVTHIFRHLLAEEVYSIDKNSEDVTMALSHKSFKSASYYLPGKILKNQVRIKK